MTSNTQLTMTVCILNKFHEFMKFLWATINIILKNIAKVIVLIYWDTAQCDCSEPVQILSTVCMVVLGLLIDLLYNT